MQTKKLHWGSLSVLIVLGLNTSFLLLAAFGMGVNSLIGLFSDAGDPAGQMISAFSFGFEGVILLMCSWFILQKTMAKEQAGTPFRFPFAGRQITLIFGIAIVSVLIGAAIVYTEIAWLAWLILPMMTVLVIVPPIWLLFGFGSKGIELGQRWRIFSILGLSMTLSPLIIIVMELILLAGGIILGAIFISVQHPDLMHEFARLGMLFQGEVDQDRILTLLTPYISNPIIIVAVVGYIAIAVPLIEELFKPLAVWIFARELESSAQGFAMGLLSGAAFALIESLNASGNGTETWPIIVSIRAGTSLLHMTTSGLVGWGVASAFREKRILRLFAAYLSAVAIHGVWNACAVGAGLSMAGELIGKPEWLFNILPAMAGGMSVIGIGMLIVLIASNKKLRNSPSFHTLLTAGEEKGVEVQ
jgi:hypothetical protein